MDGKLNLGEYAGAPDMLIQLKRAVARALTAPFYARLYAGAGIASMLDFYTLPTTSAADISTHGTDMLVCAQECAARAFTSGTTARPKRLYFSQAELDAAADYFYYGSKQFIATGDAALLLYPCDAPDGAGRLFMRALERRGAHALPFGAPTDDASALRAIVGRAPQLVLCEPAVALRLAYTKSAARFDVLLLTGDALNDDSRALLERRFGCTVFMQYGLTETCFGLGVECAQHAGYHLRNDYFVEVLDDHGSAVPLGEYGRVVITSLIPAAMPLIRYDTGDTARFLRCGCGATVLSHVQPRTQPKGYRSTNP